jgi:hypothetical protein
MTEYSNGDIQRIHERIDSMESNLNERLNDLSGDLGNAAVAIGKLETRLELAPKPPARPCTELTLHLNQHTATRRLWQQPAVSTLFHLVELALIGVLGLALASERFRVPSTPPGLSTSAPAQTTQTRASGTP